ncbi:MAG: hypothetical protein AABY04_03325 [Candidatus Micrarchaeota archaeon]
MDHKAIVIGASAVGSITAPCPFLPEEPKRALLFTAPKSLGSSGRCVGSAPKKGV